MLALEAARSGSATGEATTVLRTLPSSTRRRLPLRVRSRPAWLAAAALLAVAALVAGIVLIGNRTHHGTGTDRTAGGGGALTAVGLNSDAAHDYDPLGDGTEHADQTAFAIDGNPETVWTTESYSSGDLQKAGVGLALDAAPGAVFRELRVSTPTPGFAASIYVAGNGARPETLPDPAGSSSPPPPRSAPTRRSTSTPPASAPAGSSSGSQRSPPAATASPSASCRCTAERPAYRKRNGPS